MRPGEQDLEISCNSCEIRAPGEEVKKEMHNDKNKIPPRQPNPCKELRFFRIWCSNGYNVSHQLGKQEQECKVSPQERPQDQREREGGSASLTTGTCSSFQLSCRSRTLVE
jgi:hypothetical protein